SMLELAVYYGRRLGHIRLCFLPNAKNSPESCGLVKYCDRDDSLGITFVGLLNPERSRLSPASNFAAFKAVVPISEVWIKREIDFITGNNIPIWLMWRTQPAAFQESIMPNIVLWLVASRHSKRPLARHRERGLLRENRIEGHCGTIVHFSPHTKVTTK